MVSYDTAIHGRERKLASQKQIIEYLAVVNSIAKIVIINTKKNRDTRYRLGITVEDQKELIRSLAPKHYISGPELDRDASRNGDVWKFKIFEYGEVFYIKIKIELEGELKALSCHIDNIEE